MPPIRTSTIHRPNPGEVAEARRRSDIILKRARKLLRDTAFPEDL